MNPDPRLDAMEEIRCDEMAREERREQREDARRAEDRREREQSQPVARSSTPASAPVLAEVPNLTGLWVGEYGPDRIETIRIEQDGLSVIATKVTGDANVPAGKPTFKASITGRQSDGLGHVADTGYQNPRWVFGRLSIVTDDLIEFRFGGVGRPVRLVRVKDGEH